MISIVFHTTTDRHTVNNISKIKSIIKGKGRDNLWIIDFIKDGTSDWWRVGLNGNETVDGVPDSVTVGGKVYEGRAGIEKLASIPIDILNRAEETYRSLEEL